jgi:hypothetical protein
MLLLDELLKSAIAVPLHILMICAAKLMGMKVDANMEELLCTVWQDRGFMSKILACSSWSSILKCMQKAPIEMRCDRCMHTCE